MYFIDVQGTLISDLDKKPLAGACELIDYLNLNQIPYIIITNNTKDLKFLNYLNNLGLKIPQNRYLDPLMLLKNSLANFKKVASFGADEFKKVTKELGFELDYKTPEALLIASGDNFSFDEFANMIEILQNGAKFIALHQTSIYKKNGKKYPGVGAISSMLKVATSKEPEVIGKPSYEFYKKALSMLNETNFKNITIISDDAKGDLQGAKELGMRTILVLSGKVSSVEEAGVGEEILDEIYPNLGDFLSNLKEKQC